MPARSRWAAEALARSAADLRAGDGVAQLVRFAIAGGGVTLFAAAVYLACASALALPPLFANAVSTCCGVGVGYLVHSRWSFRAQPGDEVAQGLRFLSAAAAAFALNSLWVWLLVHALRWPAWTPVTGMVFATPLASFAINRWWVFA